MTHRRNAPYPRRRNGGQESGSAGITGANKALPMRLRPLPQRTLASTAPLLWVAVHRPQDRARITGARSRSHCSKPSSLECHA